LQDDLESAIGHFRNVIAVEPKSPEGHAELGSVLFEKQDPEAARREADLALALDPDNYAANRTLLRLFRAAGDPRVKDQSERLRKLVETREEQAKLLQRTIEVRPW
jgi:tetratricopeptide (TPR) repeat protein